MDSKVMTKAQLVSLIADKAELTKATANEVLDLLAKTAVAETKKNGQFVIPGIGKLVKSKRKARTGRNPRTGAAIKIPAKTVVKFRVAKACKDAVAPKKQGILQKKPVRHGGNKRICEQVFQASALRLIQFHSNFWHQLMIVCLCSRRLDCATHQLSLITAYIVITAFFRGIEIRQLGSIDKRNSYTIVDREGGIDSSAPRFCQNPT